MCKNGSTGVIAHHLDQTNAHFTRIEHAHSSIYASSSPRWNVRLTELVTVLSLATVATCGRPRDSGATLIRVRGGVLKVGVVEHRPWTERNRNAICGVEVEIIQKLEAALGTRAEWSSGSEAELLEALKDRKVDLVIGGVTPDSPWRGRVAFTRPYDGGALPSHVFAVAPG